MPPRATPKELPLPWRRAQAESDSPRSHYVIRFEVWGKKPRFIIRGAAVTRWKAAAQIHKCFSCKERVSFQLSPTWHGQERAARVSNLPPSSAVTAGGESSARTHPQSQINKSIFSSLVMEGRGDSRHFFCLLFWHTHTSTVLCSVSVELAPKTRVQTRTRTPGSAHGALQEHGAGSAAVCVKAASNGHRANGYGVNTICPINTSLNAHNPCRRSVQFTAARQETRVGIKSQDFFSNKVEIT